MLLGFELLAAFLAGAVCAVLGVLMTGAALADADEQDPLRDRRGPPPPWF
jgi:hypothetical protein